LGIEKRMQFVDGENVGPYRIITQLGQGGMATVFKAYHPALDRYVAIKVLHPAFMEDPGFLARFQREAKVVASLDHPNIVPIYDFAEHRGSPYLVMKFIEGETLKARMTRGPLTMDEGLRIIERVGAGLAYAHNKGILHRDIKPSNVLLAPDGAVYLADFGLARIAEAGESTLSSDTMLGTPQYISPEQARGEKDLDAGTDIYSFGVVLYELVVGRVPFSADTPFSIIHDHIYKPLPRPREINPRVPEDVERVLFKALAKSRADRYAKVEDLVSAFRQAVLQTPGEAMPDLGVARAETRVKGTAESEMAAQPPPRVAPAEPLATLAEAAPLEPAGLTRRRPWLWAVAGLAITCICLTAFVLLTRPDRQVRGAALSAATRPALGEVPAQGGSLPSLADAESAVQAQPDDPHAHMQLAEVMMSDGQSNAAAEEFIAAARILRDTRDFGLATEATLLALEAVHGPSAADPALLNMIAEFIYLRSDTPEMRQVDERVGQAYPEWDVPPAAVARSSLFTDERPSALAWANKALDQRPQDPLARSVRAEFYLLEGNNDRAIADARQVLDRGGIPGWLFEHLDGLINRASNP
jgi:predicted Ser/Thr protein kinase/tetratricopeptide (TPR) repeat protein